MEPVVIVGGGPVSLALSLVLARYKVRTLIIEAREAPTPPDESRAIIWSLKGARAFGLAGPRGQFRAAGVRRTAH